jgi:hypothetical protein
MSGMAPAARLAIYKVRWQHQNWHSINHFNWLSSCVIMQAAVVLVQQNSGCNT